MIGYELYEKGYRIVMSKITSEPMMKFFNNVLAINSHYPKKTDIFKPFSYVDIHNIKMVVISNEPSIIPGKAKGFGFIDIENDRHSTVLECIKNTDSDNLNKSGEIDYAAWIDQGILFLNISLTVGADTASHAAYWRVFIETLILEISLVNPNIWIVPESLQAIFRTNLKGKVYIVNSYDKETIEYIPVISGANYLILTPNILDKNKEEEYKNSNHFYFANKILQKTKNKKITW